MRLLRTSWLAAAALALAGPVAASAQREPLGGLDQYIGDAMRAWGIPGVAIAVVKGDSVVFARGYGVRQLGGPARVDEQTMFAIGSASKTFTSAALAMLVDQGKLQWDTRVGSVFAGFELADPIATQETTVRDLLSHRTGVPAENVIFWGTALTRGEIIARLRHIPLTARPRSRYQYQNLMFLMAGQIVPAVTGQSWDDFLVNRIMKPLGMSRTTPRSAEVGRFDNVASPHAWVHGDMRPIPWLNLDNAGPAGSIVSSAIDMAQWIRLQLGNGMYRGARLISDSAMLEMHSPQMIIPREQPYLALMPEAHLRTYGLGWMMHEYHGKLVVEHGGQTDGMHATIAMVPEEQLGVVVLTNTVLFGLPAGIAYRVIDAYLGSPARDWAREMKSALQFMNGDDSAPIGPAVAGTKPSLALKRYAGVYRHPLYGDAIVTHRDGRLNLSLLGLSTPLTHRQLDSFAPDWSIALERAVLGVASFFVNSEGESVRLIFANGAEFIRTLP